MGKDNGRNISRSAACNKELLGSGKKLVLAYKYVWIKVVDLIPHSDIVNFGKHKKTFEVYRKIF